MQHRTPETLEKSLREVTSLDDADVKHLLFAADQDHHICLIGPPGCGKTMIARRLAAYWGGPFRAPHHTTSHAGLLGGVIRRGSHRVSLGEVGRACGGTLYLDEMPEFSRVALEGIRSVDLGQVIHVRCADASFDIALPNTFHLIVSMTPCPCGWLDVTAKPGTYNRACTCTASQISAHEDRVYVLRALCSTEIRIDRPLFVPRPVRTGANLDTLA